MKSVRKSGFVEILKHLHRFCAKTYIHHSLIQLNELLTYHRRTQGNTYFSRKCRCIRYSKARRQCKPNGNANVLVLVLLCGSFYSSTQTSLATNSMYAYHLSHTCSTYLTNKRYTGPPHTCWMCVIRRSSYMTHENKVTPLTFSTVHLGHWPTFTINSKLQIEFSAKCPKQWKFYRWMCTAGEYMYRTTSRTISVIFF